MDCRSSPFVKKGSLTSNKTEGHLCRNVIQNLQNIYTASTLSIWFVHNDYWFWLDFEIIQLWSFLKKIFPLPCSEHPWKLTFCWNFMCQQHSITNCLWKQHDNYENRIIIQPHDVLVSNSVITCHHLSKFHVVELPVTIKVRLFQERLHLFRAELLPERGRAVDQLLGINVAIIVLVKEPEGLTQFLKLSHLE